MPVPFLPLMPVHHIATFVLLVVFPLGGVRGISRMQKRADPPADPSAIPPAPKQSPVTAYATTAIGQMLVTGMVLYLGAWPSQWPLFGLREPSWRAVAWLAFAIAALTPLYIRRRRRALTDPERQAKVRARMAKMSAFLPRTKRQILAWSAMTLVTGAGEEILYRGYLGWYLAHWMPPLAVAFVASAAFGIGHVYQGWKNVLRTGTFGLVFWLVYGWTGSVWPGAILHSAVNILSGTLVRQLLQSPPLTAGGRVAGR